MTFLPIVDRELRIAARRPATYRLRFGVALAVMLLGFVVLVIAPSSTPAHRLSWNIFVTEGVVALLFCLFSGVFLTADCLSIEKREGTLGLLFLTDLNGFDVVLGKLAATSLHCIYALLAALPMLGLPLLVGGVSGGEFTRLILVVLTTLFISLSTGLCVSALGQDARRTMLLTLGILVLLAGVFPALGTLAEAISNKGTAATQWFLWSPVYTLIISFDSTYRTASGLFWKSVSIHWLLCLSLFALAAILLPRTWQQRGSLSKQGTGSGGRSLRRFQPRRERMLNPVGWYFERDRVARVVAWWIIGPAGILWLGFFIGSLIPSAGARPQEFFAISIYVGFAVHQLFKLVVAIEASRQMCEDRRNGAIELMLVSPLPHQMIVTAQWKALRRNLWKPMMIALLINVLFIVSFIFPNPLHLNKQDRMTFLVVFVTGIILLILDFHALAWVGMWAGARGARHHRAVLAALGRIMLPPWIGILCFILIGVAGRGISDSTGRALIVLWLLFGVGVSFILGVTAKGQLLRDFRRLINGDVPRGARASGSPFPVPLPASSSVPAESAT
ncbi:MAG TPA: ABC transporter permease subunit [Candidatus Nitrosotalea sp.]|nr:ABC transporter permease subunit [Candidatus Nitrosotalea sp.]